MVLRNEHQQADETVELVGAGERADARPFRQVHDVDAEPIQRVVVDLEQLVARIAFQHQPQRAPVIAGGIEPGPRHHARDLAAQMRNGAGDIGIKAGGEQPDDAQLAFQPSHRREQFDSDIIQVDAPVHARLHVGLGDEQRLRPPQEGADCRRHHHQVAAAAEHFYVRVAQQSEAGALHGIGRRVAFGKAVFAHAEEGKILRVDPVQERDRLGDFLRGQRRRADPA